MPSSPSQNAQSQSPASQPSIKRRRVALACKSCRERKVRCDGNKPVCGACQRRGNDAQQCEYLVIGDTAKYKVERDYIQSLRNHIAHLEGSVDQQSDTQAEGAESRNMQNEINGGHSIQDSSVTDTTNMEEQSEYRQQQDVLVKDTLPLSDTPNSISAMGAVTDISDSNIGDQYFGLSSIVSLVQQYSQASPGQQSLPSQSRKRNRLSAARSISSPSDPLAGSPSLLLDNFSLPPRKVADWLLDVYFGHVYLFYPWVHKQSFMTTYNFLWSGQSNGNAPYDLQDTGLGGGNCPSTVFHCALNAMFALACEFSNMEPEQKKALSGLFYDRMKSLVDIDILDSGGLAHVQALLLVGQYLQCTPYPRKCWNAVGMAYRILEGYEVAYLVRLRTDGYVCSHCLDARIVSMTMGRPSMTPSSQDIPLPSLHNNQYLAMEDQRDTESAGPIAAGQFFYENTRLTGVLAKILSRIYRSTDLGLQSDPSQTPDVDIQAVLDIERALEEFESSLLSALHWDPSRADCERSPTSKRQSNVLHARFLHLKLLMYRPAFSEYCSAVTGARRAKGENMSSSTSKDGSWTTLFLENCAAKCVQAACSLVWSLNRATTEDATGAWWYGVFYLITAGIILIFADMSGAFFALVDSHERTNAWYQCINTLSHMAKVHPSARDYAIALNGFKQRHSPSESQGINQPLAQREHHPSTQMETQEYDSDGLRDPIEGTHRMQTTEDYMTRWAH